MAYRSAIRRIAAIAAMTALLPTGPATAQELLHFHTGNAPLPSNRVEYFARGGGAWWIACAPEWDGSANVGGGLARFDEASWQVFDTSNSGLPGNFLTHVAVAPDNRVWVATLGAGIAVFDGQQWDVFDSGNSPLPDNDVYALAAEPSGVLWVGMYTAGLLRYDGTQWAHFTAVNSGLGSDIVNLIVPDAAGTIWVGTDFHGLVRTDGNAWEAHGQGPLTPGFNTSVSGIAVDGQGDLWVAGFEGGVGGAIAVVRDSVWTFINGLSGDFSYAPGYKSLAVDDGGTAWYATRAGLLRIGPDTAWQRIDLAAIAGEPIRAAGALWIDGDRNKLVSVERYDSTAGSWTDYGMAFYNESGVVTGIPDRHPIAAGFAVDAVYPNPFNPSTTVAFSVPTVQPVRVAVVDVLGRRVRTLVDGMREGGSYRVVWDGRDDAGRAVAAGVYLVRLTAGGQGATRKVVLVR